jgi:diguanylate cyclase (GGDEF)-like protein
MMESPSNLEDILPLSAKKFAQSVQQSFADMIGVELSQEGLSGHTHDKFSGINVYCHFFGTVQGLFLISLSKKSSFEILELDPEDPEAAIEVMGFLKESLNVAAGNTLPLLESTFGHLSYSPSIAIDGMVQFPEFASAHADMFTSNHSELQSVLFLDLAEVKISTELDNVRRSLAESQKNAHVDALTKIYNRAYFEKTFKQTITDCHDRKHTLSLLWIDVDKFKDYNDLYGHQIGDMALEVIGQAILNCVRNNDLPFRYGGDEFVVLLPTAPIKAGTRVAENIAKYLREHPIEFKKEDRNYSIPVTLSIGVAALIPNEKPDIFLKRADSLLYLAKEKGRDTIVASKEWL